MTAEERRHPRFSAQKMVKITSLLLGAGVIFFWRVWCPIQAERAAMKLRKTESDVAQKKSDLNNLQSDYQHLTTLSMVDHWAKSHGSWKSPGENDVLTILE